MTVDELADSLWDDQPPRSPGKALQTCVLRPASSARTSGTSSIPGARGGSLSRNLTRARRRTVPVDADGTTTGMVLMLEYAGGAIHSTTGRTVEGSGVDRIVLRRRERRGRLRAGIVSADWGALCPFSGVPA